MADGKAAAVVADHAEALGTAETCTQTRFAATYPASTTAKLAAQLQGGLQSREISEGASAAA